MGGCLQDAKILDQLIEMVRDKVIREEIWKGMT